MLLREFKLQTKLLEQLLETTQEGFWLIDNEGMTLDVNSAMCQILGRPREEVVGRTIFDFVDKENKEIFRREIEARQTKKHGSYEIALLRGDGTNVPCINNAATVFDDNGQKMASIGFLTDISEIRQAEAALKRSHDVLERHVTERTRELDFQKQALDEHAIVSITDVKGNIIYANDKFCDISGYSRGELIGQNHRVLKSGEHSPAFYEDLWQTIANGKPWHGEIKNLKKGGGYYWVKATIVPFLNEQGKPFQYVAIRTDITEGKKSIQALAESRDLFSHAAKVANLCHWRADASMTQWIETSDNTSEIVGFHVHDVLGGYEKFLSRTHPEDRDNLSESYVMIARDPQPYELEYRVVGDDGMTRYLWEVAEPEYDSKGTLIYYRGTTQNITFRKVAELEAIQAKKEAEAANRAKDQFLANMSHELRTPLNAIIGFSDTMIAETFGPIGNDKYREYLSDIRHSGGHLLGLINDILDASAIGAGALELYEEEITLTDVIEDSLRLINPWAKREKITVTVSIDSGTPQIYADVRRVKQILLNLLSNAVKFTVEGGDVYVSAWLNDDGSLTLVVEDTGVGMNEQELEKALSEFGQVDSGLDRMHEGTGLGLPLTKGLMELHGGILKIKSEKGHGTSVTVIFPKERVI